MLQETGFVKLNERHEMLCALTDDLSTVNIFENILFLHYHFPVAVLLGSVGVQLYN